MKVALNYKFVKDMQLETSEIVMEIKYLNKYIFNRMLEDHIDVLIK